jgi:metal-responsive CopG/Arc/MetJ family transcriptional regulator
VSATKTISVSIPLRLARQAERTARRQGRTRSALLRDALAQYLAESKWRDLREYGAEQVKKLGLSEQDVERLISDYRAGR